MPRGPRSLLTTLTPQHSARPLTPRRRLARRAAVAAPVVTVLAVGLGATYLPGEAPAELTARTGASFGSAGATGSEVGSDASAERSGDASSTERRTYAVSRSTERVAPARIEPDGKRWTTEDLDLRVEPRRKARTAGVLDSGTHVALTGRERRGMTEVLVKGLPRWVTSEYLSTKKPKPEPREMGLVDRSCPATSAVESGLTPSAVRVYRAVCNNFPQITTYGGRDGHGEHVDGRAIDIMTSDQATGDAIAAFLQAHAGELDLYNVIWQQRIWTPERGSEGWRGMEDRGSPTANHFDHVHVSVN